MAQITFQVNGTERISRNIRVFAGKLKNQKTFLKKAIDIIEDYHDKAFDQGGKPDKWKPLAASTQTARANRWGYYKKSPSNPKTLRWTGNLQDNNTKKITNTIGVFQKNAKYAKFHQDGGKFLPQRKVLTLEPKAAAEIVRELQKEIDRQLGISGLQV